MKSLVHSDETYYILNEIMHNESLSQRELSKKLGISLGAVNALINKMIVEGFVKIEKISPKRALYMLTPAGMMEKARKTIQYVKIHYDAIRSFLTKLEEIIGNYKEDFEVMYVLKTESPYEEILINALKQISMDSEILIIKDLNKIEEQNDKVVIFYIAEDAIKMPAAYMEGVNLLAFF